MGVGGGQNMKTLRYQNQEGEQMGEVGVAIGQARGLGQKTHSLKACLQKDWLFESLKARD